MGRKQEDRPGAGAEGFENAVRRLSGFLELLSTLAEKGGELARSGEVGDEKGGVKAIYGFSVRVGGGGKPQIDEFGNVQPVQPADAAKAGRRAVVEEAREPMVDVFDEGDHLLVVAELPGVDAKDIEFEARGDVLTLSAHRGERKYRKEILLPAPVRAQDATSSYRNGVFEIELPKAQ